MERLYQTALSIISASLIAGVTSAMLPQTKGKELLRLLCGIFITVTLLTQIKHADFTFLQKPFADSVGEAQTQSQMGQQQAKKQLEAVIKHACETYILDKATSLDVQVRSEIALAQEDVPVPKAVTIYGTLPPEKRAVLQELITKDLGIAKEDQMWIG